MSLDITITGTVHSIGDVQIITEKFSKRDVIVQHDELATNGQTYIQHIMVEATGSSLDFWDDVGIGDTVSVRCRIRGKLYNRRDTGLESSFTSLSGWRVDVIERAGPPLDKSTSAPTPPAPPAPPAPAPAPQPVLAGVVPEPTTDDEDNIPF